jgi:chaperone BCS1
LSGASSVTKKKLVLTTFGFSSTKLKALVEQATEVPPKDFLSVLSFNSGNWGRTKVLPRSLASICLNTGVKENILKKLDWFLANRETYRAFGTTYKMGWLFSGEPGTGKTSLVKALASYLKQDVYLFNLSAMSDATLEVAVAEVPSGSVLLFEDIDCASGFTSREEKSQLGNGVSLGAVLSVLDGIRSAEGHLIFMTTNYPDRIDSAILRKGRTDVHISIDALEDDAVQEMSVSLFGRSVNKVSRIKGCDLQAIAFEHRDNFTSFDAAFEPFRAERI